MTLVYGFPLDENNVIVIVDNDSMYH